MEELGLWVNVVENTLLAVALLGLEPQERNTLTIQNIPSTTHEQGMDFIATELAQYLDSLSLQWTWRVECTMLRKTHSGKMQMMRPQQKPQKERSGLLTP